MGFVRRDCQNAKFEVVVCCQGCPFVYRYATLRQALRAYKKQYKKNKRYGTMNFTLQEVFWGK